MHSAQTYQGQHILKIRSETTLKRKQSIKAKNVLSNKPLQTAQCNLGRNLTHMYLPQFFKNVAHLNNEQQSQLKIVVYTR